MNAAKVVQQLFVCRNKEWQKMKCCSEKNEEANSFWKS